jgi:hypothetical protein
MQRNAATVAAVVIEVADEGGDRTLEVDVVLPERVVGVDEEGLAGRKVGHVSDSTKRRVLVSRF